MILKAVFDVLGEVQYMGSKCVGAETYGIETCSLSSVRKVCGGASDKLPVHVPSWKCPNVRVCARVSKWPCASAMCSCKCPCKNPRKCSCHCQCICRCKCTCPCKRPCQCKWLCQCPRKCPCTVQVPACASAHANADARAREMTPVIFCATARASGSAQMAVQGSECQVPVQIPKCPCKCPIIQVPVHAHVSVQEPVKVPVQVPVQVCVCMCVRVCVRACARACVYMSVCMNVCMCARLCVFVRACVCACMCMCMCKRPCRRSSKYPCKSQYNVRTSTPCKFPYTNARAIVQVSVLASAQVLVQQPSVPGRAFAVSINLRRSRDCHWLFVGVCVWICGLVAFIFSYALHLRILGSCYTAHKCIVNIMKVYIKRNNIQVELIRFRKK